MFATTPVTAGFPAVNQYTLQGDRFAEAFRTGAPVPVDIESAIANMAVIDALFRSANTKRSEVPSPPSFDESSVRPATSLREP